MEIEYKPIKNLDKTFEPVPAKVKKPEFSLINLPQENEQIAPIPNVVPGTAIVEQVVSFKITALHKGRLIIAQGHEIPEDYFDGIYKIDEDDQGRYVLNHLHFKRKLTSLTGASLIQPLISVPSNINGSEPVEIPGQGEFVGTADITGAFTSFSQYYAYLIQNKRRIKSIKIYMSRSNETVMSRQITMFAGFQTVFGEKDERPIRLDNTFSKDQFQESILECQFNDHSYIPIGKANYLGIDCGVASEFTIYLTII